MRGRRIVAAFGGALVVSALALLGPAMTVAGAGAPAAGPEPVTDYARYPLGLGIVPDTCTAQGEDLLVGERFAVDGGEPVASLGALGPVPGGAQVVLTWSGYAPGCEGVGVSLSRKIVATPWFDPSADQHLNAWSYCGPGADPCAGTLRLDLSAAEAAPCYQLDATIGPPLRVVGPSGSFYSLNGRFNTLVSAANGGMAGCRFEPCPVPGSPEGLPDGAEAWRPRPTTTQPPATTVPPTTVPTTTVPGPVTTIAPAVVSTTRPEPPPVTTIAGARLPATGGNAADLGRAGVVLLAAGLLVLAAATCRRPARTG